MNLLIRLKVYLGDEMRNLLSWFRTGHTLNDLYECYEEGQSALRSGAQPSPDVSSSPARLQAWNDGLSSAQRYFDEVEEERSREAMSAHYASLERELLEDALEECRELGLA